MLVEAQMTINASKAKLWAVLANLEDGPQIIRGIKKIAIVDKPASGLVGLKWRETRILFDEEATVEKWITEAAENDFYTTRAEDNGFVFITTMRITENGGSLTLTSSHETQPVGFVARLKSLPMFLFKGVIKKAILDDLNDIKAAVEQK